jgi:hypothetical protein
VTRFFLPHVIGPYDRRLARRFLTGAYPRVHPHCPAIEPFSFGGTLIRIHPTHAGLDDWLAGGVHFVGVDMAPLDALSRIDAITRHPLLPIT